METHPAHRWSDQLLQLNNSETIHEFFTEREVWNCYLGVNVGHEQNGDKGSFIRPVLIVQRFGQHLFWAAPLSTKIPPNSQHHHIFTRNATQYSALVTQLRALDAKRLIRKLYVLDAENYYEIQLRLARDLLRT